MNYSEKEIYNLFEKNFNNQDIYKSEEAGRVISYGDGICIVSGLSNAYMGELIIFDRGNTGIIFDLNDDTCSIFLIGTDSVISGEGARRTNNLYYIPTTKNFLGRVIDITGNAIDGLDQEWDIEKSEKRYIESQIIGISERTPVAKPLMTGILAIDALIPIGKGQRQLFIGNRNTGKTAAAIDVIIRQRNTDIICIYVAISQQQSHVAKIANYLKINKAMNNTIIISADAGKPAIHSYLAPYIGTTIAEYFSQQEKRDVLIIYDDLSNHAVAYREMSLLMKRSPAREAYPGDIFYLHARLLERCGSFLNNGSITALPIAQIQEDDISAYIPTNLISMTDGQILFDTKLFNNGIKPAVNPELSVSRVGGAAQYPIINKLSKSLRLDLAQYHELAIFSQFGSEMDELANEKLKKGAMLISLLAQSIGRNYKVFEEAIILYMFKYWNKNLMKINEIKDFINWFLSFIYSTKKELCNELEKGDPISEKNAKLLDETILEAITIFEIK